MTDTRTRLWIGLFVLVVFLAGLGSGIVAGPWLDRGGRPDGGFDRGGPGGGGMRARLGGRRASRLQPSDERAGRRAMGEGLVERMSSRLELSDERAERLRALFGARRDRFRAISREMRDRLAAEQDSFRTAIADILTPDQMAIFEAEFLRMGDRRGPGGRGSRERGPDRRGPGGPGGPAAPPR